MAYALTSKSQVTVPKSIREVLGLRVGQAIEYLVQPGGRVEIVPAQPAAKPAANPFAQFVGTGVAGMTTEQVLAATRGADWNA